MKICFQNMVTYSSVPNSSFAEMFKSSTSSSFSKCTSHLPNSISEFRAVIPVSHSFCCLVLLPKRLFTNLVIYPFASPPHIAPSCCLKFQSKILSDWRESAASWFWMKYWFGKYACLIPLINNLLSQTIFLKNEFFIKKVL